MLSISPNFVRTFRNEVDEVDRVCSSKDVAQPLFYGESLDIK